MSEFLIFSVAALTVLVSLALYRAVSIECGFRNELEQAKTPEEFSAHAVRSLEGKDLDNALRISRAVSIVAKQCGVSRIKIYIDNSEGSNAGINISFFCRTAVLALSSDFISRCSFQELSAIIAHELGHFKDRFKKASILHYLYMLFVDPYECPRSIDGECAADAYAAGIVGPETVLTLISHLKKECEAEDNLSPKTTQEVEMRLSNMRSLIEKRRKAIPL